jgi:hypothetical protein
MKNRPKKSSSPKRSARVDSNRYPKGWDRKRIEEIASHYENQSDAAAIAEAEAAYASTTSTMMQVPIELVPQVQKLIRRRAS